MRHPIWYRFVWLCATFLTAPCVTGLAMMAIENSASQWTAGFAGLALYHAYMLSMLFSPVWRVLFYLPTLAALVVFLRRPSQRTAWGLFCLYNFITLLPGILFFIAVFADVESLQNLLDSSRVVQ